MQINEAFFEDSLADDDPVDEVGLSVLLSFGVFKF